MLYANLPAHVKAYNPLTHMVALDAATTTAARAAAIQHIFKGPIPGADYRLTAQPDGLQVSMPNLSYCQRFTAALPYGLSANVYIFVPVSGRPVPSCVIYHEGHGFSAANRVNVIAPLVAAGYMVAAVDMLFTGMSAGQSIQADIPNIGPCKLWNHNHMQLLNSATFCPLELFVRPTLATLGHFNFFGVTNIAMMGLSGGGLMTTLCAAIDPRILRSYSVSGTMPLYLSGWNLQNDLGEWEAFSQLNGNGLGLDYLDLYVMAAQGRTHWQVANVNDNACFAGTRQECFRVPLVNLVAGIGGTFNVVYDNTATTHDVWPWAMNAIKANIGTQF